MDVCVGWWRRGEGDKSTMMMNKIVCVCVYIYVYVSIFSTINKSVDKITFNNFKGEKMRQSRKWRVGERMGEA